MFYWIYDYPTQYIALLFAIVFCGVTVGGIFLFRPLFRSWIHGQPRNNDMVGLVVSSFSLFYGLLIGLIAVAVYQNSSTLSDLVDKEAECIAALYRDIGGYPRPVGDALKAELREYARYTIDDSWPLQSRGIIPQGGRDRIAALFATLSQFEPAKKSEEFLHAEALRQFSNLVELRRARLANVNAGIPAILWWVVAIGAMLIIGIIWMLNMDIQVHILLGGALSLFLGLTIFLIAALDHPFRGDLGVKPDPIRLVYDFMKRK
jgi:Protein of unknown function (DUF4239)